MFRKMLAGSVVALCLGVAPTFAVPIAEPRIPPGTHGFQALQMQQAWQRHVEGTETQAVRVSQPARPAAVAPDIVVSLPAPRGPITETVTIRGADGQVRTFPIEGGRDAIVVRQIHLHPGEAVTVRIGGPAPAK